MWNDRIGAPIYQLSLRPSGWVDRTSFHVTIQYLAETLVPGRAILVSDLKKKSPIEGKLNISVGYFGGVRVDNISTLQRKHSSQPLGL